MSYWKRRVGAEARDLWELVLLPCLAAFLPWSLTFKLFRRLAWSIEPYRGATDAAVAQASIRGWVGDAMHWALVRRIVTLVDHADLYLAKTRSDAWVVRHMDVQGEWPKPGQPGLICTFHWGTGMWGLRHARASGLRAHALVAPLQGTHFAGRRVLLTYARARTAEVTRSLGCPVLDISASLRPVLEALRRGDQIMAAVDVPIDDVRASEKVRLLDINARVPRGLFRLAINRQLPITVYLTGLRVGNGRRFLRIYQLGIYSDLQQLIKDVFGFLDQAIREDPAAWHFWGEADRIFDCAE